jgi:hypothetical protein
MNPISLQTWASANKPVDDLLYKGGYWQQIMFVRDTIAGMVGAGLRYEAYKEMDIAKVISTHYSKSVLLPVYLLDRPDIGLQFVLRYNYYNWKLSVISKTPIEADFDGLFYTTPPVEPDYTGDSLHPVYFEGFPNDLIFGYYATSDKTKWSAEIPTHEGLWATVFLIMKSLGVIKARKWHTRESHAAELKANR